MVTTCPHRRLPPARFCKETPFSFQPDFLSEETWFAELNALNAMMTWCQKGGSGACETTALVQHAAGIVRLVYPEGIPRAAYWTPTCNTGGGSCS